MRAAPFFRTGPLGTGLGAEIGAKPAEIDDVPLHVLVAWPSKRRSFPTGFVGGLSGRAQRQHTLASGRHSF